MATRRSFLATLPGTGATLPVFREHAIGGVVRATEIAGARPADALADDEAYWTEIQRAFDVDRTMVNLNNGGCSPAPTHVLDQMIRDLKFTNELPVDHMWRKGCLSMRALFFSEVFLRTRSFSVLCM